MFPIYDTIQTLRVPWVNRAIILLNIAVYALMSTINGSVVNFNTPRIAAFIDTWAFNPASLGQDNAHAITTLFTSMFMHGGLEHVFGNMLFLWIFGDNIEDRLGHVKYAVFYLAGGAVAALSQGFFVRGDYPMLGASGAIGAVLGAYLLLYPKSPIFTIIPPFFRVTVPAYLYLPYWAIMQFLLLYIGSAGVALWAHIGGFVFGALVALPLAGPQPDHVPAHFRNPRVR